MIYIRHASFQLYHCEFPQKYLKELYHEGVPALGDVFLNRTRPYDFCDVADRGDWFDIFVALVQYLLSGESKVGFLNNHPRNLIHKVLQLLSEKEANFVANGNSAITVGTGRRCC